MESIMVRLTCQICSQDIAVPAHLCTAHLEPPTGGDGWIEYECPICGPAVRHYNARKLRFAVNNGVPVAGGESC